MFLVDEISALLKGAFDCSRAPTPQHNGGSGTSCNTNYTEQRFIVADKFFKQREAIIHPLGMERTVIRVCS